MNDPLDGTTQEETAKARRLQARQESLGNRQVSQVRCGSCGGFHWREVDPREWTRPCRLCGVAHGGYCTPADGLDVSDWAAFPPRREWA